MLAAASSQKRSTAAAHATGANATKADAAVGGVVLHVRKDARARPGREAPDEAGKSPSTLPDPA